MQTQRRRESPSAVFFPQMDANVSVSLVRQLYLSLRNAIADGRLAAGQRLPSTRLASREWALSRNTIAEAYEILVAEGYVVARHGSGTYVATGIHDGFLRIDNMGLPGTGSARRTTSNAATKALSLGSVLEPSKRVAFATGRIVHDARTAKLLSRIAGRHINYARDGYGDIQGEPDLRSAIAAHLTASRGVRCTMEQIFITLGTQQALDLAFRVLVTPGETVFLEDPCYPPATQALIINGLTIVGLPVDQNGLITAKLADADLKPPSLFYVTPSNQYPIGSVLSLSRRLELLAYAHEHGCWIVEDDYDSEFRYEGHPIASLQGLDYANRVIYTGTFSKALLPSLRVGYLVIPADLISAFRAMRPALDRCPPTFQQRVVADFLNEGYFPAHLRRLRERLRLSRDRLAYLLNERVGEHLSMSVPEQGINLTAYSTGTWNSDIAVSIAAQKKGVVVTPISRMHIGSCDRPGLLLGFSGLSEQEADIGTKLLARLFKLGDFRH